MGTSPTQRTMRELKKNGIKAAIVEKWNSHIRIRQDMFGIIDIIALDPEKGVVGVQSTGQDFSGHVKKLRDEKAQETLDWLSVPGTSLELWGWRKVKRVRGGTQMIWKPRVGDFFVKDGFIEFKERKV